jgi:hypothetical protein
MCRCRSASDSQFRRFSSVLAFWTLGRQGLLNTLGSTLEEGKSWRLVSVCAVFPLDGDCFDEGDGGLVAVEVVAAVPAVIAYTCDFSSVGFNFLLALLCYLLILLYVLDEFSILLLELVNCSFKIQTLGLESCGVLLQLFGKFFILVL